MSYSDKLKDPRWQKKRLEILERDRFTCCECFSESETLHVHHLIYVSGRDPWDYQNAIFLTLCEECHKRRAKAEQMMTIAFRDFSIDDLYRISEAVVPTVATVYKPSIIASHIVVALTNLCSSENMMKHLVEGRNE